MAQITCSYSGILFHCEHMPVSLHSREYHHPLFTLPKKKLLSLSGEWSRGKLTHTESYLLYLSLLHSTDLVIWRTPATYTPRTTSIVANNMESLIHIIGKIDLIQHPSFTLPKFAISYDTSDLSNSYHWIHAWIDKYDEWSQDTKAAARREVVKDRIQRREASLEKLLKTSFSKPDSVANIIANWAEDAGDFPDFLVSHPLKKNVKLPIAEYWKEIIRASVHDDRIWQYPKKDISELIDHCEDHIDHGSIHAHALMKTLRQGLIKQSDYMGFGDVDLAGRTTSFRVLDPSTSAEDANKLAAIQSAPLIEPSRHQYPTSFAYIKAKLKWDMAQRYRNDSGSDQSNGDSK